MNASRIGSALVRILLRAENIPPAKLIIHPYNAGQDQECGALAVRFTWLSIGTSFLPKLLNREIVRATVRVDDTETDLMLRLSSQLPPRFSETLRLLFGRQYR